MTARAIFVRLVRFVILLAAVAVATAPARAALSRAKISEAGFHLTPGTVLPRAAVLHGTTGETTLGAVLADKPTLLTFTDYRCRSLCGVVLDRLADATSGLTLAIGRDYNIVSVSLASDQGVGDARTFWDRHTAGSPLQAGGRAFVEDAPALAALSAAVGLVAPFDAEHGQFAHPVGLVLVDTAGRAQRILSPFALNPFDLRLALTETGAAPASLAGHALLLCYAFDPASGLYTLRIQRVLAIAAAATIGLIALSVLLLLRHERRRTRAVASLPRPQG